MLFNAEAINSNKRIYGFFYAANTKKKQPFL